MGSYLGEGVGERVLGELVGAVVGAMATFRMRLLLESTIYTLSDASTATAQVLSNAAAVAAPLSPL
jgi:hypothetical protein